MSEDNQNPRSLATAPQQGDSHVPGPPASPDVIWVPDQGPILQTITNDDYRISSVVMNASESETPNANTMDELIVQYEETDSSDTEVTLSPPAENAQPGAWESEEDGVLNMNSVIIIERESDIVQEPSIVSIPENPNAGVENPIIRLENPDYEPEDVTDNEASRGSSKRSYGVMIAEDDDGQTCPVCFDVWTNAGVHRLCSLKCGHLFGKSCISRWLSLEKKKYCPQCNKKASANDIRDLYATKLVAVDVSERTRLERELEDVKQQKGKLELELMRSSMTLENYKKQMELLKARVAALEGDAVCEKKALHHRPTLFCPDKIMKFHLEKTFAIQEGSCRVSAFSTLNNMLIVSHQIRNHLFRGYGVKKISKSGTEYQGNALILHKKALRDMCFHPMTPNLVLSVSFDKSAKLTNIEDNRTIQTLQTDHPLWSCCWDQDDFNVFYTGAGNGLVSVYDIRRSTQPLANLPPTQDFGAVVALRYAPAGHNIPSAVICCRYYYFSSFWGGEQLNLLIKYQPGWLNSVVYYEKTRPLSTEYNSIPLPVLLGPFFSLSYNSGRQQLLVSCRPSVGNPTVRHMYCEMNGSTVNKLFAFHGGTRQTLLCRSCFVPVGSESLCAVFQENTNTIELWNTSDFSRFQSIPVNDHILDLISIKTENRNFLGSVSDSTVRFFEGPT